jgi:hypothetical protein
MKDTDGGTTRHAVIEHSVACIAVAVRLTHEMEAAPLGKYQSPGFAR